jgi:single-strand DNA-binding protein
MEECSRLPFSDLLHFGMIFYSMVAWNKLAELCNQLLAKGRKVCVEGRLATREWAGQDGQKRQRTEIVADDVIILDNKGKAAEVETAKETTEEPF